MRWAHQAAFAQTGPMSIMVLCDVDALSGYGALIAKQGTTTTNAPYELRLGASPTDSKLNLLRANASSFGNRALPADVISAGSRGVALCLSFSGRDPNGFAYIKGGSDVTSGGMFAGTGAGDVTDNGADVWIGRRYDGATQLDGRIYYIALFNRAVTQSEAVEWSANKWSLYEPRRVWVPVSAGGGSTSLTVNETTHAHSADALTLTTSAVLTISDSTHAHAAESPAPSSSLGLTIAEALHGHAADSLTLSVTGSESLVTADATHGHAADSLALSSDTGLTVADALHAHAADNLTLDTTGAATLTTQDATHAHAVDAPMLYTDWLLAVAEATHGHAADNVSLSDAPELAPQDATHGHTADVLALSADTWLTIQQATQAQAADNVTLGGVAPEPWPLLATRGVSAHGHGSARPEQRSTATRRNVQ